MIVTNLKNLARVATPGVIVRTISAEAVPGRWKRNWLLFWNSREARHLVVHFDILDLAFLSILFGITGRRPCITTLDMFAGDARGWKLRWIRWIARRVDRFLVYFRNTNALEQLLNVDAQRFHYVPFKINAIDQVLAATPEERPYIFSGGRSRRDFRTLFAAVRGLPYRVFVLTSEEAEMNPHGSTMSGLEVPANVEISRRDSDQAYFIEQMAQAKLVVLPLIKGVTTQAGISIYIQAMAMGKCVIVSQGLGVDDVLTDQAFMIPAGDADALRSAITRCWENDALRAEIAERGYCYAMRLGGEDDLARSVLAALPDTPE